MRPAPGVRLLAAEQALPPGPDLTKDSYAHPTISALTDPVLASSPGRTRSGRLASYRLVPGKPMSSRDSTIIGYLTVLAAGITLQAVALRRPTRLPSLGRVLPYVMRTRTGRAGVVVAWAWVGLHFFAR